ncbi:cytochrome P450 9e2-like [Photinus pyralis]|uniref:Cytochrome P450 n=1 Tax=Photinus pyralis TaxID=7054 RepID=A0A1Y1KJR3_PHOPY|nr:cytochrome P450 9e2-like [Photinus pyralis]
MLIIVLFVIVAILIYYQFFEPFTYWRKRGVPHEKPTFLFGNLAPVILQQMSMADASLLTYQQFKNERYIGVYYFLKPGLVLRDPELIKLIFVKEFETFPEHNTFTSVEADPIWSNSLFAMPGGQHWRDMRAILSPTFTSSKLRQMFCLIDQCTKQFIEHLVAQGGFVEMEMKDAFSKVTNDIIATTAFGVTCDSLTNPTNELFRNGKEVSNFSGFANSLKFFISNISPSLAKLMKIRFISAPTTEFFRRIVKETVTLREEKGVVRPDLIHLLMEARKGKLKRDHSPDNQIAAVSEHFEVTDDIMTAQAVVFFMAGFDTSSTAMSYTTYELALNYDIQQRLIDEVDRTFEACDGKLTYDLLMGMKYLDMVISEALRKWPPFAITDRCPVRPFTLPSTNGEKPLLLDRHVVCQIPIYAIHRDETYYPEPVKFDPERFSEENKHKIKPFTYLPFGVGPRNCIGSRFALLEVKIIIAHILRKFEIVPIKNTPIPLTFSKDNVNPVSDKGYWVGLKPRM